MSITPLASNAAPPPFAALPGALSVRSHVVHALRAAILTGALKPGDQLSDGKLCEEYGVSRTSIREALRYLESEKLITILPNRRACVARVTPRQAATIYELLTPLFGDAAALLARTLSPRTAQLVRALQAGLEQAQGGAAEENLARFHGLVLQACGDTVLQEIGGQLLARIGYLRSCSFAAPAWRAEAVANTCETIAALTTRNHEAARRTAQSYFQAEAKAVANVLAG